MCPDLATDMCVEVITRRLLIYGSETRMCYSSILYPSFDGKGGGLVQRWQSYEFESLGL